MIALVALVAAAFALGLGLLGWRRQLKRRIRTLTAIDMQRGVEDLHRVALGGLVQTVLVRGRDRDAPLLLYLHGGPGEPFLASARSYLPELEQAYTVAYWAQRGTLGSYRRSLPRASMTLEQMLSDTHDLIEWLCDRYARERLVLMGGSWGSVLGAITAARHPDRLLAYIARSQVVDNAEADAFAATWVLERAAESGDSSIVRRMERFFEAGKVTPLQGIRIASWVARYGGYVEKGARARAPGLPISMLGQLWGCPDVTVPDLLHALSSPLFGATSLWKVNQELSVEELAARIEVPVYFLQGRSDVVAPGFLVERYFEQLEAPAGKQLVWFERSQHLVHLTERAEYLRWLVERIPGEIRT